MAVMFRIRIRNNGPAAIDVSNVTMIVRRSRRVSTSSFSVTVKMRSMARLRGQPFTGTQQGDERVLQCRLAGLGENLRRGSAGDHATVADDHYGVAQRGDFLHDVSREQDALARGAQFAQQVAQVAD